MSAKKKIWKLKLSSQNLNIDGDIGDAETGSQNRELTAKNDVSFQIALSKILFALLPRKMGFVRNVSNKFMSNNTLFAPVVSEL